MTDKINVLHIVAGNLNGGAARGAYWLHQGLIKQGIQSKILSNSQDTLGDPNIETVINSRTDKLRSIIHRQIDSFPLEFYSKREKHTFSTALGGIDITRHPLYRWADIIHLHWINAGFINIKYLKRINKPIVWTLRDMWPFTGGCHYTLDCNNYKIGCGSCPQLGSTKVFDLSRFILNRKKKFLPNTIKIVGISPWLTNKAKESLLFKNFETQTIFNNVNCDEFFPIKKCIARKTLGLNSKKKIILIGAYNIKTFYKGFDLLIKSLKHLNKDDFHLAFFGKLDANIASNLDFSFTSYGFLNDTISLRLLYSAADVFVAPSRQEAFGKTIVEAMACGTPVTCFDATGPKDIVDHKINGYKAKAFNSEDLAIGIKWVTNNHEYNNIAEKARLKAVEQFDQNIVANNYIALYKCLSKLTFNSIVR